MTTTVTDELMRERISQARVYTVMILYGTEKLKEPGAREIVWEHGRRNFQLRDEGKLPIVCPVADGGRVSGIGIFTGTPEEVARIMDGDPGIQAGLFAYEVHACRGFPGSALPA